MISLKKEITSLLRINYFRYRPPAPDCIHGKDEKQVIDLEWPNNNNYTVIKKVSKNQAKLPAIVSAKLLRSTVGTLRAKHAMSHQDAY